MTANFPPIGGSHAGIGGENSFWPSFTDIMMVVTMIFLMATSLLVVRNWQLVAELQESIAAEHIAAQMIESTSLENATLEEHSVPLLSSLSQQTKDNIPTIFYERHDYSDNQAQSTVVLNGKSTKVGGSPTAGLKVEEILPDSVVLSYRGTQFRLRALNSWINL